MGFASTFISSFFPAPRRWTFFMLRNFNFEDFCCEKNIFGETTEQLSGRDLDEINMSCNVRVGWRIKEYVLHAVSCLWSETFRKFPKHEAKWGGTAEKRKSAKLRSETRHEKPKGNLRPLEGTRSSYFCANIFSSHWVIQYPNSENAHTIAENEEQTMEVTVSVHGRVSDVPVSGWWNCGWKNMMSKRKRGFVEKAARKNVKNVNNKNCLHQHVECADDDPSFLSSSSPPGARLNMRSMDGKFVCYVCMISTESYLLFAIMLGCEFQFVLGLVWCRLVRGFNFFLTLLESGFQQ